MTVVLPGTKSTKVKSYPTRCYILISMQGPNQAWVSRDPYTLDNPVPQQQGQNVDKNHPLQTWWQGDLYALGSAPNTVINIEEGIGPA